MIRAGRNRKRPYFKRPVETRLSDGSILRTWETFKRWWVSVRNENGRELMESDRTTDRSRCVLGLRYMEELREEHRIEDGPFRYEIDHISNREERGAEMQVLCTRRRLRCLTANGVYIKANGQHISIAEEGV